MYRIPVCIFLFVSGTIISVLFSNALNDMIVYGRLTTQLTDPGALIGNIFTQDKLGRLFFLLEALVVLICIVYFVCAKRTYQADTYAVTDNLSIPVPYGQGQHGTTWFMSEKEKKEVFDYIKISPMNPLVSKLVALGKERYDAIENGEEYTPPKLDKTLCKSGGIVLAREMSGDTECLPCITDDIHTLTIGATRSGKSRCLVLQSICTIALAGEGLVVNDPKGELYHYTHCYLESLGYTVRVVDFNSPQKSTHYNPLQVIIDDVNKGNLDAAQRSMWDFVTFLVEKNDHTEPIWTNGECAVIAAAVMCVVYDNNIRENANTYAVVSQERIDDLYMQLRQQSDTDIIVDCTSDISQSKLTAKAVITADVVIELLTCDTNGLVFDGSQEPILQSEQYTYRKFVRMMSLSSVFKQDEAAMKNAMGRISGTIPYCPKAAEYLNQGTLLTKGVDDRTYNTTIKSLAEIIMKEE